MTYDEFIERAIKHPDVREAMSYGRPAIKRGDRFMFNLKKDGETMSAKMDWDTRDRLLMEHPEVCFITPHFYGYPGLLINIALLESDLADEIIGAAWEDAPNVGKRRSFPN